jgi:hypothetical protein
VIVTTRLDFATLAALLGVTAGCNLILGTEPPLPIGTGGGGMGGGGTGGVGSGPAPCGDAEWTHWDPAATHTYDRRQGLDGKSIVVDALTGLAWQSPPGTSAVTWEEASAFCAELSWGGLEGYRLPTVVELASLTRYDLPAPALDPTAFPDTTGGEFWTGTPASASSAFVISHGDGHIGSRTKGATAGVWCVRDLKPAADASCTRYAFADGEDSVRDVETGLVWQRAQSIGTKEWAAAKAACAALPLAGQTWRLPEVSELITLLDFTGNSPSGLDPQFFDPGEPAERYWSATADVNAPTTNAWRVNMESFATMRSLNTEEFRVRCVR